MSGYTDQELFDAVDRTRDRLIDHAHNEAIERVAQSLSIDPDTVEAAIERVEASQYTDDEL